MLFLGCKLVQEERDSWTKLKTKTSRRRRVKFHDVKNVINQVETKVPWEIL